jgi:hypothetical protein
MYVDASDRTLGLISIWQVLRKLLWEIELIKATPDKLRVGTRPADILQVQDARLYATINAASTALALVDWLYHTVRADQGLAKKLHEAIGEFEMASEKDLLRHLRNTNSSINACHQICNANKHFHLKKPDKQFKVMVGEIVMEHADGTTDLSQITHIMQNRDDPSAATSVLDMLEAVARWWESLLTQVQVPGRGQFFPQAAP